MLQYSFIFILEVAPTGLHLPQFTYTEPKITTNTGATTGNGPPVPYEESLSQGYPFSVFFQPSSSVSPGLSITRPSPGLVPSGNASNSVLRSSLSTAFDSSRSASSFIGFSWGPLADAFPPAAAAAASPTASVVNPEHGNDTPAAANLLVPIPTSEGGGTLSTPRPFPNNAPSSYSTPRRPYALSPYHNLQRTSTIRRSTATRRSVSDREAMKQLVDCVGMSARKKVLESGRKPRVIGVWSLSGMTRGDGGTGKSSSSSYKKELRFDPLATPIPRPDYGAIGPSSETGSALSYRNNNNSNESHNSNGDQRNNQQQPRAYTYNYASSSEGTNTDSEDDDVGGPPSPSPRPGSAMSTMSVSRRSGTPTTTTTTMLTMSGSMNNLTAATGTLSSYRTRGNNNSVAGTSNLSIPSASATSAGPLNLDFKLGLLLPPAAAASLAVPSARRHSNPEPPQSRFDSLVPVLRDESGSGDLSYVTEFQSRWDELEMRHAAMMEDIEDLEERFEGLSSSLMVVG